MKMNLTTDMMKKQVGEACQLGTGRNRINSWVLFSCIGLIFTSISISAQVTSTFSSDGDGWTVVNGVGGDPAYLSSGGNPGGFIRLTDNAMGPFTFFIAPSKFLGDKSFSYGKNLSFDLQVFNSPDLFSDGDVRLTGGGISIVINLTSFPAIAPSWSNYSFQLDTSQPWKITDITGPPATESQIRQVLANLTQVAINGEYSGIFSDMGGLDNVILEENLPPTITSFTPASGPIGTTVTITGTNFNTTPANNIVYFGATRATVVSSSSTQLSVILPIGCTYAPITVLNTATSLLAYSTTNFTPTFTPNKGSITASDFNPKVDFTTGLSPYSVSLGDLDGDGKADLVVTNSSSNSVSVFRNTSTVGTISYAAKVDFSTGAEPTSVSIGDLDGDGKADLAVANYTSNTVSVFRNTSTGAGNINYAAKVDFTTGTQPTSVSIGDLDGDGKADLAVSNYSNSTVSVFRNTSTGTGVIDYAIKEDFSTGTSPRSVSIGDLDDDGKADLAVVNEISNTVSVFRNTSPGTGNIGYAAKVDFTTGSIPTSLSIGDLDGDGKADLVVINRFSNTVSVFRNTSTGIGNIGYDAKVDFTTGSIPRSVSIGDLNGDGKIDLLVANQSSNTISVLRNTSTGVGIISYATKIDLSTGLYPRSVSIGDLDGDGKADLIVLNRDDNTLSVIRNNPIFDIPTITSFNPTTGPIGTTVTITGTNFDATPTNNIVYFGATRATVSAATATQLTVTVPAGATYQPITVQVSGLIAYSRNKFTPAFTGGGLIDACAFAPKVDIAAGVNPLGITINDFDGDGKGDIAITNRGSNLLSVYRNTSVSGVINAGSLSSPINLPTLTQPWSATAGDIDGDGKLDLIVANAQSAAISIYRNTSTPGSISFDSKVDFASGLDPWRTAIADLDGDGKPEVIVSNRFSNSVSVYKNTSSSGSFSASTFAAPVSFSTGTEPYDVSVGDINGDNKPDIVALNNISNSVSVFQNTTSSGTINSGSFATKVDFPTSSSPYGLALADVDGDSKLDILASNNFAFSTVSILHNESGSTINTSSFSPKIDFAVGSVPNHFGLADFDGDSKVDLAITNSSSNTVTLLKNTSSVGSITATSFAAGISIATGLNPAGITAGDIDGDGRSEIVVGNFNSGYISVYQNLIGLIGPPTISSFTPSSASIGSTVTITGTNFDTNPVNNIVTFNGVAATVTASTATSITTTVPVGATTGNISIQVGCNTVTSSTPFTIAAISITTQPSFTYACEGSTATFTVSATGTTNITYRWQKYDGTDFTDLNDGTGYSGTTTSTLSIDTDITGFSGSGEYRCRINGDFASELISNDAQLTINSLPSPPDVVGDSDCTSPAILTLTASGASDGNYNWYTAATGGTAIAGETNATFAYRYYHILCFHQRHLLRK